MLLRYIEEGKMYQKTSKPVLDPMGNESSVTTMKVIGVGGAGCNAINRMINEGIRNVQFVAVNTDMQALNKSMAQYKLDIGSRLTRGLGAGAKPEIGEKAAQEDIEEIRSMLEGSDMVFITAGMGGGTGTGAAPIFAQVAKEIGALTVAVVTLPFEFEGRKRYNVALEGIERLKEHVDTMLVISNSRIFKVIERRAGVKDAFNKIDEVLKQAVQGISSIISETGEINVDFADVKTVLSNKGEAIMGIGIAHGESRAIEAAKMALENPLIENTTFTNAGAMLVNIIGGSDFTMNEYEEAASTISDYCRDDAEIIIGLRIDENMKDKVRIIIVATDFVQHNNIMEEDEMIPAEDIFEPRKVIQLNEKPSIKGKFRPFNSGQSRGLMNNAGGSEEVDRDIPAFIRKRRMG